MSLDIPLGRKGSEHVILADSGCSSSSGNIRPRKIPDFDLEEKTFSHLRARLWIFYSE